MRYGRNGTSQIEAFRRLCYQFVLPDFDDHGGEQIRNKCLVWNYFRGSRSGFVLGLERQSINAYATAVVPKQATQTDLRLLAEEVSHECNVLWQGLHSKAPVYYAPKVLDHAAYQDRVGIAFQAYHFYRLKSQFADQYDLPDVDEFLRSGAFCFEGVQMRFLHTEDRPDRIQIQADLGHLAQSKSTPSLLDWADYYLRLSGQFGLLAGVQCGINPNNQHFIVTSELSIWADDRGSTQISATDLYQNVLIVANYYSELEYAD